MDKTGIMFPWTPSSHSYELWITVFCFLLLNIILFYEKKKKHLGLLYKDNITATCLESDNFIIGFIII